MSDRWRLDEQVALVTGAGRGLGVACAKALAAAGATVVLVARTDGELRQVAEEICAEGGSAIAHAADLVDGDAASRVVALAEQQGDLRVLVNNAGTNRPGPALGYKIEDWEHLFALNVRATFLLSQAVGASLIARGASGSIVNISSQLGAVGFPGRAAYCATKHAVEGLTRALGVEWAPHGVRVNSVAPTFVETPLTRPMLEDPEFKAEIRRRLPTGVLATAEQVADAVRYLACPASGSVTGSVIRVDGGWTAW